MYGKKMNRYMPQTDRGMSTSQGPTMRDLAAPSVNALEHDDPFVQEAFNQMINYYELGSGARPVPDADFWDEVYTLASWMRDNYDPVAEQQRDRDFADWEYDPYAREEKQLFPSKPLPEEYDEMGRQR